MDKIECFKQELDMYANDDIKSFAAKAIMELPDYFFEVAASSSGRYHPDYALGEGGLVRHTKAAVRFANHIFQMEHVQEEFTERERDLVLTAIILHDGWKHGDDGKTHTVFMHPQVSADWVRGNANLDGFISGEEREVIAGAIESHMGQWNTNKREKNELKKPKSKIQKFVHMCDYLASRKDIEILFDNYEKPEPPSLDDYILSFGKHKGEKLVDVAASDAGYIAWCKENMTREPIKSLLKQV